MSILVWRQMNEHYALGTDGTHSYTVTRLISRGTERFSAWRILGVEKPAQLIDGYLDEPCAKAACTRDLKKRLKAKAAAVLQTPAIDQSITGEEPACS